MIQELVEAERDEVAEHNLDDRAAAAERKPVRDADDAGLADRGIEHALRMVVRQTARRLERTAVRRTDVLTEQQHALVFGEPGSQRAVDRRELRAGLRRRCPPLKRGCFTDAVRACREVEHRCRRGSLDRSRDALAYRPELSVVAGAVREKLIQRIATLVSIYFAYVAIVVAFRVRGEAIRVDSHEYRPTFASNGRGRGAKQCGQILVAPRVAVQARDSKRGCARADVAGQRLALRR